MGQKARHRIREKRIERSWRLVRQTSSLAAATTFVILVALDARYGFDSAQLNWTIGLLALFFIALSRLDLGLHRIVQQIRSRRMGG